MQRKLKSVFRNSSRRKSLATDEASQQLNGAPSHTSWADGRATSLDGHHHLQSPEGVQHNGRSRPLSSVFDSHHTRNASGSHMHARQDSSEPTTESIANDYRAYLPVLSSANNSQTQQSHVLAGDMRVSPALSNGQHEEGVADRNIDRYGTSKPLPATPVSNTTHHDHAHQRSIGGSLVDSATTGRYSLEGGVASKNSPEQSALGHTDGDLRDKTTVGKSSTPSRTIRKVSQSEAATPLQGEFDKKGQTTSHKLDDGHFDNAPVADGQEEIQKEIEQLLEGVVDLRNTVDEDKDVQWAPAVTHEVVKAHKHEIVQHKIFREVHNYEFYHHIQPIYDLEVLPPRHWIPNPHGEGLIEISADELPTRTGNNRRWKIVQEQAAPSSHPQPMWRTEPEIIEHPPYITDEGFERRETTIIYPPTLQDMSEYEGLVQPAHFDHKTGKRWLGEVTTMRKLRVELGQIVEPNSMDMKELAETLPEVPGISQVPGLSQSPELRRKPVNGPLPPNMQI